jgi:predicted ATPase/DNA-binding NarL/FixJ family response regulator/transcriptional regulator with XRE-family HTH domain
MLPNDLEESAVHHNQDFGARLRKARIAHDMTQEALAEAVGCATQTVRSLENGRRRPSREMAIRLAEILQVPLTERDDFIRKARAPLTISASDTLSDDVREATGSPAPVRRRVHLPLPFDPLIGRHGDLQRLRHAVVDQQHRLVTVLGPGGIGKTRLALQVAADLAPSFADGVAFVALAPVTDVANVRKTVADAIGCVLPPTEDPESALLTFLRERVLLLILDNLEHLLGPSQGEQICSLLMRVLHEAPAVHVIVTSRERLRLRPEWVIELEGLALPVNGDPNSIARAEAVLLFLERARQAVDGFALTSENRDAVARICHRLDGLPLALELAAAQVSFLPPAVLLARLDHALPLLGGGARDLPARQRTMRAAIGWSHDLLPPDERALFRRLAVFIGGFRLEAAEAVGAGGDVPIEEVLRVLRRLVDQSLVVRHDAGGDHERYRLLEPVRQFALEQLEQSGEAEWVRERHAAFFVTLAEESYPALRSAAQVAWLARLDGEYPNMREAMTWLIRQGSAETVTGMGWSLYLYQWMRGHFSEGRRWMEWVLTQESDVPSLVRALALLTASVLAYGQAEYAQAQVLIEESVMRYHVLADEEGLARTAAMSGLIAAGLGQYDRAVIFLEEGVRRYLAVGDKWGAALTLIYWAVIPLNQGDYASAVRLTEQAIPLARETGDRVGTYTALYNLALVAQSQHNPQEAARLFREALVLSLEMGDEGNIAYCLEGLAGVAAMQGKVEYAARLWGAAELLLEQGEAAVYAYTPDRAAYARTVAAARSQLDAQRWSAAWAEGCSMSKEQIVAQALRDDLVDSPQKPLVSKHGNGDGTLVAATGEMLTPREVEVLRLIAQGLRNREIAEQLVINEKTVQNHISNIFAKLGVADRSQAIVRALQDGLIALEAGG